MKIMTHETPLGIVRLGSDGKGLSLLQFEGQRHERSYPAAEIAKDEHLKAAAKQLDEYFAGKRTRFDLPLSMHGTAFQQKVWAALCKIGFGETRSYADIALSIGAPKAMRAVGAANGRNPVGIIVPCHRVIGANGALTGYAGGMGRKQALLAFEQGEGEELFPEFSVRQRASLALR
jgi:methylated-DNA-[protein]-cysteine S-methyltransferase